MATPLPFGALPNTCQNRMAKTTSAHLQNVSKHQWKLNGVPFTLCTPSPLLKSEDGLKWWFFGVALSGNGSAFFAPCSSNGPHGVRSNTLVEFKTIQEKTEVASKYVANEDRARCALQHVRGPKFGPTSPTATGPASHAVCNLTL